MADQSRRTAGGAGGPGPSGRLAGELQNLLTTLAERATSAAGSRIADATERLTEYAADKGGPGLVAAVTGARARASGASPAGAAVRAGMAGVREKIKNALTGKGGKGGNKIKVTNIVESLDVGVPRRLAYDQWTQFEDFPGFMKKVENVTRESDEKLTWKAQVFWSHRTWESTITEQVPDKLIAWRSKGQKGSVDGTVTFHELAPDLTRILVVLEYHPQGLFERTGNLWRAQGRRARLELKHYARHVMTQTVLHPDDVKGWRGEIHDGRVVKDHDAALAEEGGGEKTAKDGGEKTAKDGGEKTAKDGGEKTANGGGQKAAKGGGGKGTAGKEGSGTPAGKDTGRAPARGDTSRTPATRRVRATGRSER